MFNFGATYRVEFTDNRPFVGRYNCDYNDRIQFVNEFGEVVILECHSIRSYTLVDGFQDFDMAMMPDPDPVYDDGDGEAL